MSARNFSKRPTPIDHASCHVVALVLVFQRVRGKIGLARADFGTSRPARFIEKALPPRFVRRPLASPPLRHHVDVLLIRLQRIYNFDCSIPLYYLFWMFYMDLCAILYDFWD